MTCPKCPKTHIQAFAISKSFPRVIRLYPRTSYIEGKGKRMEREGKNVKKGGDKIRVFYIDQWQSHWLTIKTTKNFRNTITS
jgi:hypothetical protein